MTFAKILYDLFVHAHTLKLFIVVTYFYFILYFNYLLAVFPLTLRHHKYIVMLNLNFLLIFLIYLIVRDNCNFSICEPIYGIWLNLKKLSPFSFNDICVLLHLLQDKRAQIR